MPASSRKMWMTPARRPRRLHDACFTSARCSRPRVALTTEALGRRAVATYREWLTGAALVAAARCPAWLMVSASLQDRWLVEARGDNRGVRTRRVSEQKGNFAVVHVEIRKGSMMENNVSSGEGRWGEKKTSTYFPVPWRNWARRATHATLPAFCLRRGSFVRSATHSEPLLMAARSASQSVKSSDACQPAGSRRTGQSECQGRSNRCQQSFYLILDVVLMHMVGRNNLCSHHHIAVSRVKDMSTYRREKNGIQGSLTPARPCQASRPARRCFAQTRQSRRLVPGTPCEPGPLFLVCARP